MTLPLKADSGEAWATKQAQEGMAFLLREINVARHVEALRQSAYGFLNTARRYRDMGDFREAMRLARLARWHMTHSLRIAL